MVFLAKQHYLSAAGGLLCVLLTASLLETGAMTIRGRQSAATPDFVLETPDMDDVPDLGGDGPLESGATADIDGGSADAPARDSPDGLSGLTPEEQTGPLERVAPRPPLSQPAVETQVATPTVLRHPVALSAGLVDFDGHKVQLDGLLPQQADRVCGEGSAAWPCGTVARTAFRAFLRGRALVCVLPDGNWTGTVTASCTVGGVDPAVWLAENGWGEASDGSPLEEAMETAQRGRQGFFGDDPRGRAEVR